MPSDVTPSEWDLRNNPKTAIAVTEVPGVEFTVGAESGTDINVAIQLVDDEDNAIEQQVLLYAWISATNPAAAIGTPPSGGAAIGTDGVVVEELTANASFLLLTDAAGAVDIDVTEAGAGTWYLNVQLPGGAVVSSDALTFT